MRPTRRFLCGILSFAFLFLAFVPFGQMIWREEANAGAQKPQMAPRVYKVGSRGGYVWELQGRLKYLGFYKGKVDGRFGWGTYRAVKWFQSRFGLKADGVVGPRTKARLWKATRNWQPAKKAARPVPIKSQKFSQQDINLLARAVYSEARGEPYIGQVAIAAVILNRLESDRFPNTIAGIIFQPGAFEAVADGQIWLQPDQTARRAVRDAINGWDPSGGALYYFNPARATSKWIWSRPQIKRIGKHIFCK